MDFLIKPTNNNDMDIIISHDEKADRFNLYIDGILQKNSTLIWNINSRRFEVNIKSYEDVKTISSCRTIDLPEKVIFNIDILKKTQIDERLRNLIQIIIRNLSFCSENNLFYIGFRFLPVGFLWNKPFSFAEYLETFINEKSTLSRYNVTSKQQGTKLFVNFEIEKSEKTLSDIILETSKLAYELHTEIESSIAQKIERNFLLASFNFPEEIKVSCKQYLEYFAQFLQDLGIKTISNINEEAGKVLFSVTPTNDIEALDKIREALAVYLNLPSSPIVYDDSFAAMRLQQQIENLEHSQKMAVREIQLAEKVIMIQSDTIREKNTTILQKDSTIEQQSRIIEKISSESIMMDSLENREDFEQVFDGLEFGESKELKEKLGIKFNPITSLKSLGKKLSGDDEITSLNLNEETDKIN